MGVRVAGVAAAMPCGGHSCRFPPDLRHDWSARWRNDGGRRVPAPPRSMTPAVRGLLLNRQPPIPARGPQVYAHSMPMTLEEVLRIALALEAQDRADLAAAMIDSLDPAVEHGAQGAWQSEIERRSKELESGATESLPWDVVRERLARAARG